MTGRRSGRRLLPGTRPLLAVLYSGVLMVLSGALMLLAAALPTSANPAAQPRGHAVEARHATPPAEPSAVGAEERGDAVAPPAAPTGKLGYAPPGSSGTEVNPLDLFTLDTGAGRGDAATVESAWAATDPDRGPPAHRQ
ncbi:hypothetical protein [Jiangella gansuensis]|uniref:hypothetical protein n=1 Tax=Jiangella gansuensis TaxID=281473 RepID=UPI0004BC5FC7|nr:hypothetical protein [Jiangella gansuensis]